VFVGDGKMHQELKGWVAFLGIKDPILTPLNSHTSVRKYYRIEKKAKSFLVMDASNVKESVSTFIGIGVRLKEVKVRIPLIRSFELDKGFVLLEDVGSTHLFDQCTLSNPGVYYEKAMTTLVQMQEAPVEGLMCIDEGFLIEEMNLMLTWYFKEHLGRKVECVEGRMLLESFMFIAREVLAQPQDTFVHGDYHAKHLMVDSHDEVVVLGFQDAKEGPLTYDLVSLLRDAYVSLDARERRRLILLYKDLKNIRVSEETFMRWFDFTGIQRHLKLLGLFAQFGMRDGKAHYLDNIPLVLQYILDVGAKYPELDGLVSLLTPEEKDSIGVSLIC
jgi:aminoglycoside/choline kinase family phosphotransferase